MARRLVVIGAGPIGLAAGLEGSLRGYEVTVLERGSVGEAVREWGPTRFFTPSRLNFPAEIVPSGVPMPNEEELLTGEEMTERVLLPISRSALLRDRVRTGCRVTGVSRVGLTRMDFARHPIRAEKPFRVFFEEDGEEGFLDAEVVMDASGGYALPNPSGGSGVAVPGERACADRIIRSLGGMHRSCPVLRGRRILLVGHGHSASNAIGVLDDLARDDRATRVTWAVRSRNARPCEEVAGDPLPERQRVVARANDLARQPPPHLRVERGTTIEGFEAGESGIVVRLSGNRSEEFDRVVSLTGFRPDLSFLSELPLELAADSEGTSALSRSLSTVKDCLTPPRVAAGDFETGEPGFFLVGSKSYGRRRTFLLQTGFAHLRTIFSGLA